MKDQPDGVPRIIDFYTVMKETKWTSKNGMQDGASSFVPDWCSGQMLHVPYKGSGPAMTDLVGGQVNMMFETALAALPFIKSGQLRTLASRLTSKLLVTPHFKSPLFI